jgi:hypothetical protein
VVEITKRQSRHHHTARRMLRWTTRSGQLLLRYRACRSRRETLHRLEITFRLNSIWQLRRNINLSSRDLISRHTLSSISHTSNSNSSTSPHLSCKVLPSRFALPPSQDLSAHFRRPLRTIVDPLQRRTRASHRSKAIHHHLPKCSKHHQEVYRNPHSARLHRQSTVMLLAKRLVVPLLHLTIVGREQCLSPVIHPLSMAVHQRPICVESLLMVDPHHKTTPTRTVRDYRKTGCLSMAARNPVNCSSIQVPVVLLPRYPVVRLHPDRRLVSGPSRVQVRVRRIRLNPVRSSITNSSSHHKRGTLRNQGSPMDHHLAGSKLNDYLQALNTLNMPIPTLTYNDKCRILLKIGHLCHTHLSNSRRISSIRMLDLHHKATIHNNRDNRSSVRLDREVLSYSRGRPTRLRPRDMVPDHHRMGSEELSRSHQRSMHRNTGDDSLV